MNKLRIPTLPPEYLRELNFDKMTNSCFGKAVIWDGTERACLLWTVALLWANSELNSLLLAVRSGLPLEVLDREIKRLPTYGVFSTLPRRSHEELEGYLENAHYATYGPITHLQADFKSWVSEAYALLN